MEEREGGREEGFNLLWENAKPGGTGELACECDFQI